MEENLNKWNHFLGSGFFSRTEAEIMKIMGSNWSSEKRAFFHEHAWQEATGMDKDFETIEEMLENIFTNYDEY